MAVSTLTKITAGFFSFFYVQCFLCPQFLMDTNFVGLELDDMHKFFLRQMGLLGFGQLYYMLTVDSDKFLPFHTVLLTLFLLNGPGYAQLFLNVRMPDHLFALGGFVCVVAYHYKTLLSAKGKTD